MPPRPAGFVEHPEAAVRRRGVRPGRLQAVADPCSRGIGGLENQVVVLRELDGGFACGCLLGEVACLAGEVFKAPPRCLHLLEATVLLRAVALEQVECEEGGAEDDDEEHAYEQHLD